jgi:hypothetical protein
MKGVVFLGDRKLELREFPDPTPGPRDVILEIKASGMCGSDLHNYRASAQPAGAVTGGIKREAGVIAGHEPCGTGTAWGALKRLNLRGGRHNKGGSRQGRRADGGVPGNDELHLRPGGLPGATRRLTSFSDPLYRSRTRPALPASSSARQSPSPPT